MGVAAVAGSQQHTNVSQKQSRLGLLLLMILSNMLVYLRDRADRGCCCWFSATC